MSANQIAAIEEAVNRKLAEDNAVPVTDPKTGIPKEGPSPFDAVDDIFKSIAAGEVIQGEGDYNVTLLDETFDHKPKPYIDQDLFRAYMQPESEQFMNALIGGVVGAIPMAGELLARLPDEVLSLFTDEELYENHIADAFKSMREGIGEALPIYTEQTDEGFDLSDPAQYANLLKGVLESVGGFALSGGAITGTLGMASRAFGLGKAANQIAAATYKGISKAKGVQSSISGMGKAVKGVRGLSDLSGHAITAFSTNMMEGNLMAAEIQEKIMKEVQPLIDNGLISEKDAYAVVKEEIQEFRMANRAMMVSDFIAVRGLMKGWNKTRQAASLKPLWKGAIMNAPLESFEEMYQNVHALEAEYDIKRKTGAYTGDSKNWMFRAYEFAKDPQTLAEAAGGFLGGPLQIYGMSGVQRIGGKSKSQKRKEMRKAIDAINGSTKSNIDRFSSQLQKIEEANDPKAKELAIQGYTKLIKEVADRAFVSGTADALYRNLDEVVENKEKKFSESEMEAAALFKKEVLRLEEMYIAADVFENSEHVYGAMYVAAETESLLEDIEGADVDLRDSLRDRFNKLAEEAGAPDGTQVNFDELLDALAPARKSKGKESADWYSKFISLVTSKEATAIEDLKGYKKLKKQLESNLNSQTKAYEELTSAKVQKKAKKENTKRRAEAQKEMNEEAKKKKRSYSQRLKDTKNRILNMARRKKTTQITEESKLNSASKIVSSQKGGVVSYQQVTTDEDGNETINNRVGRDLTQDDMDSFPDIQGFLDKGDSATVLSEKIYEEEGFRDLEVSFVDKNGNIKTELFSRDTGTAKDTVSDFEKIINSDDLLKLFTEQIESGNKNAVDLAEKAVTQYPDHEFTKEEIDSLIARADDTIKAMEEKPVEGDDQEETTDLVVLPFDPNFILNDNKQSGVVRKDRSVSAQNQQENDADTVRELRNIFNKIAFLSRPFMKLFDNNGDPIKRNGRQAKAEYVSRDELIYNMLNDPKLSKEGTEVVFRLMEGHEMFDSSTGNPITYEDTLQMEEDAGVEFGYRPIGIFIGEALIGYMHDIAWVVDPANYEYLDEVNEAYIKEQANKLMKLRRAIAGSKEDFKGKIIKRSTGKLFKIVARQSPKKVDVAFPDYKSLTKVIITSQNGPIDENGDKVILRGRAASYASNIGAVYLVDRSGMHDVIIPIRHGKLTSDVKSAIRSAIEIFIKREAIASGMEPGLASVHQELKALGYDVTNMEDQDTIAGESKGIVSFVRQFTAVNLFKKIKTGEAISEEEFFNKITSGTPFINISDSTVTFGVGKEGKKFIHSRNETTNAKKIRQDKLIQSLSDVLDRMIFHTSEDMLRAGKTPVVIIKGESAIDINSERTGVEFLAKNVWLSYNESINVGTQENPDWVNTHQPIVLFDIDGLVEDGETIKSLEEEKQEEQARVAQEKYAKVQLIFDSMTKNFLGEKGLVKVARDLEKLGKSDSNAMLVSGILLAEYYNTKAKSIKAWDNETQTLNEELKKEQDRYYDLKSEVLDSIIPKYIKAQNKGKEEDLDAVIGWEASTFKGIDHTIFIELPGTGVQVSFHGNFEHLIDKSNISPYDTLEGVHNGQWDKIMGVPLYKLQEWINDYMTLNNIEGYGEDTLPLSWAGGISSILEQLETPSPKETPDHITEDWIDKQVASIGELFKIVETLSDNYRLRADELNNEDTKGPFLDNVSSTLTKAENLLYIFFTGKVPNTNNNIVTARVLSRLILEMQFYLGDNYKISQIPQIDSSDYNIVKAEDGLSYRVDKNKDVFNITTGEEVIITGDSEEMEHSAKLKTEVIKKSIEQQTELFVKNRDMLSDWNPFSSDAMRESRIDDSKPMRQSRDEDQSEETEDLMALIARKPDEYKYSVSIPNVPVVVYYTVVNDLVSRVILKDINAEKDNKTITRKQINEILTARRVDLIKMANDPKVNSKKRRQARSLEDNFKHVITDVSIALNKVSSQYSVIHNRDKSGEATTEEYLTFSRSYDYEDFQRNPMENVNQSIRKRFSVIPRTITTADGKKAYSKVLSYGDESSKRYKTSSEVAHEIMDMLRGVENTWVAYAEKLSKLKDDGNMTARFVLDMISKDSVYVQNGFVRSINRRFTNMINARIDPASSLVSIDRSDFASANSRIIKRWKANAKVSPFFNNRLSGNYHVNQDYAKQWLVDYDKETLRGNPNVEWVVSHFDKIGIRLSEETVRRQFNKASTPEGEYFSVFGPGEIFGKMRESVEKDSRADIPPMIQFSETLDSSYTKELASMEVFSGEFIPINQRIAAKIIYNYSNPSYTHDQIKKLLSDPAYVEELLEVPYSSGSQWLKLLANPATRNLYTDLFETGEVSLEPLSIKGKDNLDKEVQDLSKEELEFIKLLFFTGGAKKHRDSTRKTRKTERVSMYFMPTMADRNKVLTMKSYAKNMELENGNQGLRLTDGSISALFQYLVMPEINAMIAHDNLKDNEGSSNIAKYEQGVSQFLNIPALNLVDGIRHIDGTIDSSSLQDPNVINDLKDVLRRVIENKISDKVAMINRMKSGILFNNGLSQIVHPESDADTVKYNLTLDKRYQEFITSTYGTIITSNDDFVQIVATDMVANYMMFNTEVSQTITTEPANFYKGQSYEDIQTALNEAKTSDEKMGILANYYRSNAASTFLNRKKRLADLASSGVKNSSVKIRDDKELRDMKILVVQDRVVPSDNLDFLKEIFGGENDMFKAYKEITSTDGASINLTKEHIYYRFDGGQMSEDSAESINDSVESGESLSRAKVKQYTLNAFKPAIISTIPQGKGKPARHLFVKTATIANPSKVFSDTSASAVDILLDKYGADMLVFESSVKTGLPESIPNIFMWKHGDNYITDQEYILKGSPPGWAMSNQINPDAEAGSGVIHVPIDATYQQQEVPQQWKNETSVSTQNAKMALVNLPEDFTMDYTGVIPEGLSIEEGKPLTRNKLVELYEGLWSDIYNVTMENTISKLVPKGENRRDDMNKLSAQLIEQGRKLSYDVNEMSSLLTKDGEFIVPLWMATNPMQVQHLLMSMSAKKIIKQKMIGGSFTLASDAGIQKAQGQVIADDALLQKYSNSILFLEGFNGDSLQGKRRGKDGIELAQVLIPSLFILADGSEIDMRQFVDDDGKLSPDVDKRVLEMFGFRIPNQGPNSTIGLEIAGFLPPEMGNIAITTKDVVKQMGSDFDLDKLYSYMYASYLKDGQIKIFSKDDYMGRERALKSYASLKQNYHRKVASVADKDRELLLQVLETTEDTLSDDDLSKDAIMNLIEKINSTDAAAASLYRRMMYYKRIADGTVIAKNGITEINLAIQKSNNNEVQKTIHMPLEYGDFSPGKDKWIKDITDAYAGKGIESDVYISEDYETRGFLTAKDNSIGKGLFSSEIVLMAQLQILENKGLPLTYFTYNSQGERKPFYFKMAGRVSKGGISGKLTINKKRERFYEMQSMQSISVDGETLQVNERLNFNQETFEVVASLIKLGWTGVEISLFLNQPIIRLMVDDPSAVSFVSEEYPMRQKEMYSYIGTAGAQGVKQMLKNITFFGDNQDTDLGEDYWKIQQAYLSMYEKIKNASKVLNKPRKLVAFDSMNIPNTIVGAMDVLTSMYESTEATIDNVGHLVGDFKKHLPSGEIDEYIKKGYVQIPGTSSVVKPVSVPGNAVVRGIIPSIELWTSSHNLFPYTTGMINMVKDSIAKTMGVRSAVLDSEQLIQEMTSFVLSSDKIIGSLYADTINLAQERARFIMDDSQLSLATVVASIQSSRDPGTQEFVSNNPFFKSIVPVRGDNEEDPSYLTIDTAYSDDFDDDNVMHGGVEDMLKDNDTFIGTYNGKDYTPRELMIDIVRSTYVNSQQSGYTNLGKFVPVNLLAMSDMGKQAQERDWSEIFSTNSFGLSSFAVQKLQHNASSLKVVSVEDIGRDEKTSAQGIAAISTEQIHRLFKDDIAKGLVPYMVNVVGNNDNRIFLIGENGMYYPIDTLGFGPISEFSSHRLLFGESVIPKNKTAFSYNPVYNTGDDQTTMRESREDQSPMSVKEGNKTIETIANMLSEMFGMPVEYIQRPNLNAKAWYDDGKIFVNTSRNVLLSDIFHEFSHPLIGSLKHVNKPLFDSLYAELANLPEGRNAISRVITKYNEKSDNNMYVTPGGTLTDLGKEEAIVTALGYMAEALSSEQMPPAEFVSWFAKMWKALVDLFKKASKDYATRGVVTPASLSLNTTMKQIADMLVSNNSTVFIDPSLITKLEQDLLQNPFEIITRTDQWASEHNQTPIGFPVLPPKGDSMAFKLVRESRSEDVKNMVSKRLRSILLEPNMVKSKYVPNKNANFSNRYINNSSLIAVANDISKNYIATHISRYDDINVILGTVEYQNLSNHITDRIHLSMLQDAAVDFDKQIGVAEEFISDFNAENAMDLDLDIVLDNELIKDAEENLSQKELIGFHMIFTMKRLETQIKAFSFTSPAFSFDNIFEKSDAYRDVDKQMRDFAMIEKKYIDGYIFAKESLFDIQDSSDYGSVGATTKGTEKMIIANKNQKNAVANLKNMKVKDISAYENALIAKFASETSKNTGLNVMSLDKFIIGYQEYISKEFPLNVGRGLESDFDTSITNRIGPSQNTTQGRNAFNGKPYERKGWIGNRHSMYIPNESGKQKITPLWWYTYEKYGSDYFFHEFQSDFIPDGIKNLAELRRYDPNKKLDIGNVLREAFAEQLSALPETISDIGEAVKGIEDITSAQVDDIVIKKIENKLNSTFVFQIEQALKGYLGSSTSTYFVRAVSPALVSAVEKLKSDQELSAIFKDLIRRYAVGDGSFTGDDVDAMNYLGDSLAKDIEANIGGIEFKGAKQEIDRVEASIGADKWHSIYAHWRGMLSNSIVQKRANTDSNEVYNFLGLFFEKYLVGSQVLNMSSEKAMPFDPFVEDHGINSRFSVRENISDASDKTRIATHIGSIVDHDNESLKKDLKKDYYVAIKGSPKMSRVSGDVFRLKGVASLDSWVNNLSYEDLILMAEEAGAFYIKNALIKSHKYAEGYNVYGTGDKERVPMLIAIFDSLTGVNFRVTSSYGETKAILSKDTRINSSKTRPWTKEETEELNEFKFTLRKMIAKDERGIAAIEYMEALTDDQKTEMLSTSITNTLHDNLRSHYNVLNADIKGEVNNIIDMVRSKEGPGSKKSAPTKGDLQLFISKAEATLARSVRHPSPDFGPDLDKITSSPVMQEIVSMKSVYLSNSVKDAFNTAVAADERYVWFPTTKATMLTQGYINNWDENAVSNYQKGFNPIYGFRENNAQGTPITGSLHKEAKKILGQEGVINRPSWSSIDLVRYDLELYKENKILRMSRDDEQEQEFENDVDNAKQRTSEGNLIDMKQADVKMLSNQVAQLNSRKRKIRSLIEKKDKSKGILDMVQGKGSEQAREWKRLNQKSKAIILSIEKLKSDIKQLKEFDFGNKEQQTAIVGKVREIMYADMDFIKNAAMDNDAEIYEVGLAMDMVGKYDQFANILREDDSDAARIMYLDSRDGDMNVPGVRTITDSMFDYKAALVKKENDHLTDLNEKFLNKDRKEVLDGMALDIDALSSQFLDISQSGIPIFGLTHAINRNLMSRAMDITRDEQEEFDELYTAASSAAGGNDALYDLMSQVDEQGRYTGRIVYPISQLYFDSIKILRKEARDDKEYLRDVAWKELSEARARGSNAAIEKAERKYAKAKDKANKSAKEFRKFLGDETHVVNPENLDNQEGIEKEIQNMMDVGYSKENAETNIRRAVMRLEDYKAEKEVMYDQYYNEELVSAYAKGIRDPLNEADRLAKELVDKWDERNSPFSEYERILDLRKTGDVGSDKHDILIQRFLWAAPVMERNGVLTEWFDPKYQTIQENDDLLKFYDFLQDTLSDFNWYVPASGKNQYRGHTAMPIISKDVGSLLLSEERPGMISTLLDDMYSGVRSEGANTRSYNPYERQSVSRSSIFNTKAQIDDNLTVAIAKKEGEIGRVVTTEEAIEIEKVVVHEMIEKSSKNIRDTIRPMIQLHNIYKQKNQMEDTMRAIEGRVLSLEGPEVDEFGSFVHSMFNEEVIKNPELLRNAKNQFKHFMDIFYGKSTIRKMPTLYKKIKKDMIESVDQIKVDLTQAYLDENAVDDVEELPEVKRDELKERLENLTNIGAKSEKSVTVDDVIKFMMYGVQLKAMGLNISSAIGNFTIGMTNNFINAGRGTMYKESDMRWGFTNALTHLTTSTADMALTDEGTKQQNILNKYNVVFEKTYYEPMSQSNFWRQTMSFAYTPTRVTERIIQGSQMLAMIKFKTLSNKKGIEHSLYDALDINAELKEEFRTEENIKNWEGDAENINENNERYLFEGKMAQMIKITHGNYDPNSPLNMDREVLLRMMATFKKWFFTNMNDRWGAEYDDPYLGALKGRYRTGFLTYTNKGALPDGWTRMQGVIFNIEQLGKKMVGMETNFEEAGFSEVDAANMRANLNELIAIIMINLAMLLLSAIAGGDDDDKEKKAAYYYFLTNKLKSLLRDVTMWWNPFAMARMVKDPVPVFNVAYDLIDLATSTVASVFTGEWEYETGIYAHQNKAKVKGLKITPFVGQYYKLKDLGSKMIN